jgi:ribonuclease HII
MGYILGIDEVGRGAWAGPLVIGAVILNHPIKGLTDSKLLTIQKRQELAEEIVDKAEFVGLGWAEPAEIDSFGLSAAHVLACRRAVRKAPECSQVIIDGNFNYLSDYPNVRCQIKADLTVPAVSAASIVAKVARDKYMAQQASIYKNYGFDSHVGYGTRLHIESLRKIGVCNLHRKSYKPIIQLI